MHALHVHSASVRPHAWQSGRSASARAGRPAGSDRIGKHRRACGMGTRGAMALPARAGRQHGPNRMYFNKVLISIVSLSGILT